jgi:hypothetical protein
MISSVNRNSASLHVTTQLKPPTRGLRNEIPAVTTVLVFKTPSMRTGS